MTTKRWMLASTHTATKLHELTCLQWAIIGFTVQLFQLVQLQLGRHTD